jgi:sialidase-1
MREDQYRLGAWSDDGGETWGDWYEDKALPDVPCMAGIYRMTDSITYEKSRVLYCGTNYHLRAHYTIRMSYDEGITWPVEKEIYPGPSAYGQMVTMSDNETMALLLEAGTLDYRGTIHFLKFDLAWLTGGTDTLNKL